MTAPLEERELVQKIRETFPDDSDQTDQWLIEHAYDREELGEMTYHWIEAFADRTNDAVRGRNAQRVKKHTDFLAYQFRQGPDCIRSIIDVAYAENLLWNVSREDKKWAWPHISPGIQDLYVAMWGPPRF